MEARWVEIIDELVERGAAKDRSDFIRKAVYQALLPYIRLCPALEPQQQNQLHEELKSTEEELDARMLPGR
jgi:Arc/MetJ-type ribon-helix-helix transcriptional regulator